MMAGSRRDWLALGLLLAVGIVLLGPGLLGSRLLYYRDIGTNLLPFSVFVGRSLAAGQLPIWNPFNEGGYPQLAGMQPPLFYPPGLLTLIWTEPAPAAVALAWYLALHYGLMGALTYALCRSWRWTRSASLTAALCFELSGYAVSLSNLYTLLPAAALVPLVLLLAGRAARSPSRRNLALGGLACALQVSCCRPDAVLLTLLLATTHGALEPASRKPRALAMLAGCFLLGTVANAVTLLPAREFIAHSNRAGGIPLEQMAHYSLHPLQLLQLVLPGFPGDPEAAGDWIRQFINRPPGAGGLYFVTLYTGAAALVLALCAASPRRQPWLAPGLAAIAGAALLLALGKYTPLFGWFARLPLVSFMRFPIKFMLLWAWAVALLAGLGMEALVKGRQGRYQARILALLLLLGGLALGLQLGQAALGERLARLDFGRWAELNDAGDLNGYMRMVLPGVLDTARRDAWAALLIAVAAAGLVLAAGCGARWAFPALLALLTCDLLAHNAPAIYFAGPSFFDVPPLAARLVAAGGDRPDAPRLWHPYGEGVALRLSGQQGSAPRGDATRAEQADRRTIETLSANAALLYAIPSATIYASISMMSAPPAPLVFLYGQPRGAELAAGGLRGYAGVAGAAGIGWLLAVVEGPPGRAPDWLPALAEPSALESFWRHPDGLLLYRNRLVLPRARFVTAAEVAPTPREAALALARHSDRLDRLTVLVANDSLAATLKLRDSLAKRARVQERYCRLADYGNTRVAVENSSPESGWVVLADNHYPGWEAAVDGQPRPLVLADSFARAVYVEAGVHVVEFRYRPRSLVVGLLLSGLAGAALAGLGWRGRRAA